MTNRFLFLAFLLFAARTSFSQEITRRDADSIIKALNETKQRVDRGDLLLNLAQFHILRPGEKQTDFDSAMVYIKEAAVLNRSVKSPDAFGYLLLYL